MPIAGFRPLYVILKHSFNSAVRHLLRCFRPLYVILKQELHKIQEVGEISFPSTLCDS